MKSGIIVTIVVLLSIVGLGFFQYQQLEDGSVASQSLSRLTTAFSASTSSADADMSEVNHLLSVLDQVSVLSSLNTGLFTTSNYAALRDFSVTLFPAQSVGRTNPFLELEEGQRTATSTSASTTTVQTSIETSAQIVSQPQSRQESEPEPQSEPEPEVKIETEPRTQPESKPESRSISEPEPEPETGPEDTDDVDDDGDLFSD